MNKTEQKVIKSFRKRLDSLEVCIKEIHKTQVILDENIIQLAEEIFTLVEIQNIIKDAIKKRLEENSIPYREE